MKRTVANKTRIGLLLIPALLCNTDAGRADSDLDPWSVSSFAPVVDRGPVQHRCGDEPSTIGRDYCFILLNFYQRVLSVVTISHCPMVPSCSNYSIEAIHKHGPFIGIAMTADRLYHEGTETRYAPIVRGDGSVRFLDPVENNDFWWSKK